MTCFINDCSGCPTIRGATHGSTNKLREFLEDLELLADSRYHYTGTVALHEFDDKKPRMDTDSNAYALVDIVDGQQRLTTIVRVLDETRRALITFSDTSKGLSQGIVKNFVSTQEINGQPLFKLSLNPDTDHYEISQLLLVLLAGCRFPGLPRSQGLRMYIHLLR